jgi:hypothetical protein
MEVCITSMIKIGCLEVSRFVDKWFW